MTKQKRSKIKSNGTERPAPKPVSGYMAHDVVALLGFRSRQDAHQSGVLDKIDKVLVGPNIFLYDAGQVEEWAEALRHWRQLNAAGGAPVTRAEALTLLP